MKSPIDKKKLRTERAREAALDKLGRWIVDQLASKADDRDAAEAIISTAIEAFYDIREAADQPRGEYAGHFFLVDAVGLDNTDRPVPWEELAARVTKKQLAALTKLFDATERRAIKQPPAKAAPPTPPPTTFRFIDGRFPAPLPAPEGPHGALLALLHAEEQAALSPKGGSLDEFKKRARAILKRKRPATPDQAVDLAASLFPIDLGVIGEPDRTRVKGAAQWRQQDRESDALFARSHARKCVWALLVLLARGAKREKLLLQNVRAADEPHGSMMMYVEQTSPGA